MRAGSKRSEKPDSPAEKQRAEPSKRGMEPFLKRFIDGFVYLAYPVSCGSCARPAGPLFSAGFCRKCLQKIHPFAGPCCSCCGLPLHTLGPGYADSLLLCGRCRKSSPPYTALRSYGPYAGVLRDVIHRFKYGGSLPAGRIVGRLFSQRFSRGTFGKSVDIIMPVPIDRKRFRERGFNQAESLARMLAKSWSMGKAVKPLLVKVRATAPQSGLGEKARRKNVRNVFMLKKNARVKDKVVILVDDVVTTGATLGECARVLRAGGTHAIYGLTAARTLKH